MARLAGKGVIKGVIKGASKVAGEAIEQVGKKAAPKVGNEIAQGTEKLIKGTGNALVDSRKFSDYIFREGADHGKDVIFRNLGYGKEHSAELTRIFQQQASSKFANGQYSLGKLDQYGQRINIEIELPGIGQAAGKTSYINSGWMIKPDGTISLNTPFSGFTR